MNPKQLRAVFRLNVVILRNEMGLSQTEFGKRARMPQSQISTIESGRNCPTIDTIARLAESLEVTPAELLTPRQ